MTEVVYNPRNVEFVSDHSRFSFVYSNITQLSFSGSVLSVNGNDFSFYSENDCERAYRTILSYL